MIRDLARSARIRNAVAYLVAPLAYRNPVWMHDPPSFYDRAAAHVPAYRRVPLVWRVLPVAWRPVRVYLRAGDHALFILWWWSVPLLNRVVDRLGLDPVVRQWERENALARDLETARLSAPAHQGHGCKLDPAAARPHVPARSDAARDDDPCIDCPMGTVYGCSPQCL